MRIHPQDHEAGINAGFQNSSIRTDAARPGLKRVFPMIGLNTLLAFLLSSIFAIAAALIALDDTIRDPEQVTRKPPNSSSR